MTEPIEKPLLLIDVDGVISLFGFVPSRPPAGRFQLVDGVVHLLSATAGEHLRSLEAAFDLVWCTGWEEKANEYLPFALELDGPLPFLTFRAAPGAGARHWKLAAIDGFAGRDRPLAWIDDDHNHSCRVWAARRPAPTLLVRTDPPTGMTAEHVARLLGWAERLPGRGELSARESEPE